MVEKFVAMHTPSRRPSRFPAVAGTTLGLLAAALGAWFLYPQHLGPAQADKAAAASAVRQTTPKGPAVPASPLNREQAEARLMALPELQAWAKHIEQSSGGKVHGAVVAFDAGLRDVGGKRYHQLDFVENRPDAAVTWGRFLVGAADGEILVDDAERGTTLTLQRWRSEQQPMQRTAGATGRP
ncbi:hypothetical protein IP91_03213 [Pseudoduganella lurida]|uniref:Uncharacterized protein n=2 Tax=Pseudoduganella lurida TaxID=1036180 RepID=A0A562R6H2_9BURK|nr:hypothetical protein IP91_03213 [Pseudoduganella lurida]